MDRAIGARRGMWTRRRRQAVAIFTTFSILCFVLGSVALIGGFRSEGTLAGSQYLVGGSVCIALGLFLTVAAMAFYYRKGWLGNLATEYGDTRGDRWAVSPTASEMEDVACPRCGAESKRVFPACWKCGLEFRTDSPD